jgi:hypothetical protein
VHKGLALSKGPYYEYYLIIPLDELKFFKSRLWPAGSGMLTLTSSQGKSFPHKVELKSLESYSYAGTRELHM